MYAIIVLNIVAIFLAFLSKYRNSRFLFEFSFLLIFLFTAFRYNFGTDYSSYELSFNQISRFQNIGLIQYSQFSFEPSWTFLNYLFKPLGFSGFIIVLSAFICYTYYNLIKKYIYPQYYWLAVFIYVFSFDIMWIQISAIRQAFSISIFIHSIKYLNEKKNPIYYVLLNLFGGLFHSSAYFMLPLVIFSFDRIRNNKLTGIIILAVFWIVLFFGSMFLSNMIEITSFISGDRYLSRFEREIDVSTTLIGSIVWGALLAIVIYYTNLQKSINKVFFYITSLHSLVYVFAPLVWLADRMGYYFAVFSVISYPLIMQYEKNKLKKIVIISLFSVFLLYRFSNFLKLEWVIDGYATYSTIFNN